MSDNDIVKLFTDGSCLGNPGPGGWAVLMRYREHEKEIAGGFALTTNNRMELMAAIRGLESLTRSCRVLLYTDSRYLCDAVNRNWLKSWKARGWKKADKKPVLNRDLWESLDALLLRHHPELVWVEGHSGHAENERVDDLARKAASGTGLPPDSGFVEK